MLSPAVTIAPMRSPLLRRGAAIVPLAFLCSWGLFLSIGLLAQSPRIVAIGDIHGSLAGLTSILRATGLIDASNAWTGGRTVLMQTGDYMDRGEDVRAVMDLLMALETQAKDAGGRALALLGNHEVMNLLGETRDANPPIFSTFADAQSEATRQAGWTAYAALAAARKNGGEPVSDAYGLTREQWMEAHPIGYLEYRAAMSPKGKYGRWLRGKPMVTAFGGAIFMHAGINPAKAPNKIDDLNDTLRDEVRLMDRFLERLVDKKLALPYFTRREVVQVAASEVQSASAAVNEAKRTGKPLSGNFDLSLVSEGLEILKMDTWLSLDPENALWYRGLSTVPDDPSGAPFAALLAKYGQQRFVTGHTPTQNRSINVRFGGRAFLIDTGMNTQFYQGRASALELIGDQRTAVYVDSRTPLN